jgi:DNA-binding response OmpR family regulator/EAL domain-containing protein (putative c-di-GMP-specific phosphodiesterase class I)
MVMSCPWLERTRVEENKKPKIAIIDDDEDIVEVTKAFLRRRGFEVFTAFDGESGIQMVRSQHPDLVLLDLMLPDIEGYEVCRRLKEDSELWHTPIIYFTAKGEFSDKITGLKSGGDDYVTKPFEPEELLARIWMILNRNQNVLDANPLSKLPGNNAIQKQISFRLEKGDKFAIAHMDIDHFKSFNDEYGFERGDQAINGLAQLLAQIVKEMGKTTDFVGHIGGDDFVLISTPDQIDRMCEETLRRFDSMVPSLYDEKDRKRGYLVLKNRQGILQEFPMISLSIAVVTNEKRILTHIGQVNAIAAELKKYAKSLPGSNYVRDRRDQEGVPRPVSGEKIKGLEETSALLYEKKISVFFQPVVMVQNQTVIGYESNLRGLNPSAMLSQEDLYNLAIELKMEKELLAIYMDKLRIFSYGLQKNSWILTWIHPKILMSLLESGQAPLQAFGIDARVIIHQIKSADFMRYEKLLKDIVQKIGQEGSQFAFHITSGGTIPLTLLTELKPQFVFLSEDFTNHIASDMTQQTMLKVLIDMTRALKAQLLVSGVSTAEQCEILKSYGVECMSGKYFNDAFLSRSPS